jgi:hypothetical protein
MNTKAKFLIGCAAIALPLTVIALPLATAAQTADANYCRALSNAYRSTAPTSSLSDVDVPVAMAKCAAGDTAAGIPVLEKALENAKVNLPPHV